jgi:hypothetical protein
MCLDHVRYGSGSFIFNTFTGCYDDKTEILTKEGWKYFKDLRIDDYVACLSNSQEMYWNNPSEIQMYHYTGEMVKISHRSHDLLVTPDHNMFIRKRGKKEFEFIKALECNNYMYDLLNTVNWSGNELEIIKIGDDYYKVDDFLDFLGWYITDGFINHTGRGNSIFIRQKKSQNFSKISKSLDNLGVNWSFYEEGRFYFSSKGLHKYLKLLGKTEEKHIPKELMNLSTRQLKILFNSLIGGDGHRKSDGQISFYTSSKKLKDQFQELCLKIGFNTTTNKRVCRNSKINGRDVISKLDQYEITITKNKIHCVGKRFNSFKKEMYDGMVYCCTVSEHIICVKRNGKITWCGNSGKTTTVLKTIYDSEDGLTWMSFEPKHKIIEENIELSKVIDFHHFIHLESRAKLCLSKEHRRLANEGINITPFCENFCTLKATRCPYYENLRMVREMPTCLAGVHAHIPTLMQTLLYEKWEGKCLYNYYDVIVIDEFPSSTIYNQIGVAKFDIDRARDILELTDINTDEAHVLRLILDEMSLATGSIALNYAKLFSMMSTHKGLDFDAFREQYDDRILTLIMRGRIKSPPKDIIHYLMEIYKARPNVIELKWMIYKSEYSQWHKGSIFLTFSNLKAFQNLPCKVIALDGTADLQTWRAVLGDPCEILSFDIEYKDAYQLLGARNPTSTIVKKGQLSPSGMKMFELLKAICKYKKQKVLICATKRIQVLLAKQLKKSRIKNYDFSN